MYLGRGDGGAEGVEGEKKISKLPDQLTAAVLFFLPKHHPMRICYFILLEVFQSHSEAGNNNVEIFPVITLSFLSCCHNLAPFSREIRATAATDSLSLFVPI